jgi:hypothetical protein
VAVVGTVVVVAVRRVVVGRPPPAANPASADEHAPVRWSLAGQMSESSDGIPVPDSEILAHPFGIADLVSR